MADELFTKNFMLMFLSNFLICLGFYMLMPVLPDYAANYLKISNSEVGIVLGSFALSAVVLRPFMGIITDRVNRMLIYIPTLVLFSLCSGSYAFAVGFFGLIFVRMLHGFSWSGVSTANSALVADIVPAGMRGQGMGYFGLSMTIAMSLGPAFGVYLTDKVSYGVIFAICMCISLTALGASSFIRPPAVKRNSSKFSFSALFEKRVAGIALLEFFFGFSSTSVMSFVVLHGKALDISGIGYFFIIHAICVSIVRVFGGKVIDRRGPFVFLYSGFAIYIAGCIILALATNSLVFLSSAIFTGFGGGMIMPTLMAMIVNVVPQDKRGVANATVLSALDTGIGIGGFVLGFVADLTSYLGMYIFAALILLIPYAYFHFFERKRYVMLFNEMKAER